MKNGRPLFVYGTLRRGEAAEHLMRGSTFVGTATIRGLVTQRGGFLGLLAGDGVVPGEVFDLPEALFERLDQYEGPGYSRRLSEVECGGETITAWVYWLKWA
jgi:gamma-glutamylcyclotransferase (GGCT)/AIG2-like uncharacterized protein YtfP